MLVNPRRSVFVVVSRGHRSVFKIDSPDELAPFVQALAMPGDIVICLGAGTITQWAYALPQQLADLERKSLRA